MSTHRIDVVRIGEVQKHPNADTLGVTKVFGWTCCVRLTDFKSGDLVAYIPPDYIVPKTDAFAFLNGHQRIRVKRLRGVLSQGLIIAAPPGSSEGDNVIEQLGIVRYEPPEKFTAGTDNEVGGPSGYFPKYDVESYQRYRTLLVPGECVAVTEKIHGANARYLFDGERMWVGSRTSWKLDTPANIWWRALRRDDRIEIWCRKHPGLVLYGEVYGEVQALKYGLKGQVAFMAFDVLRGDEWLSWEEFRIITGDLDRVPVVTVGAFDETACLALAEGDSSVTGANHMREGVVIRPIVERVHLELGRVQLKIVSNRYLES